MKKLTLFFFFSSMVMVLTAQYTFDDQILIQENDHTGLLIDAGDGKNSYVDFLEAGNYKAFIYWSGLADELIIHTNNSPLFLDPGTSGVGIGTSAIPANYKLAVDGLAMFEKVTVKLSETWPDYVFSKDYPLQSLEETKLFVEENKRLPNMPSAEEVAEEGIDLGAMDARLLEKIEELYLHVIELNDKVDHLEEENLELKDQLQKLKKK